MATRLDANDPASLAVLQDIEAVYIKRAQPLNITLPSFNGQGHTGSAMLDQWAGHLRDIARVMKLNGDDVGCDPHCDEDPNSCPPCEGWLLGDYQDYLASLMIAAAVNIDDLHKIEAQYLARVPYEQRRNPAFKLPPFVPPQRQRGPGRLRELLAFHRYLQVLPASFSDNFGCDPHCHQDPNSCPPCEDWERGQYEQFLVVLQQQVTRD